MKRVFLILALCAALFAGWTQISCDQKWEYTPKTDPAQPWLVPAP